MRPLRAVVALTLCRLAHGLAQIGARAPERLRDRLFATAHRVIDLSYAVDDTPLLRAEVEFQREAERLGVALVDIPPSEPPPTLRSAEGVNAPGGRS